MIVVLISWIYYSLILFILGYGVLKLISNGLKEKIVISFTQAIITGIIAATIYAQFFSLFYKVSLLAHVVLLCIAALFFFFYRKDFCIYKSILKKYIFSWNFLYVIILSLLFAFFTSRGKFHADTMLYHAEAIRWVEEFGVVKGLANLQQHFGYNSSYFSLVALFSMKFITGTSLHTLTGYVENVLCVWAVLRLRYVPYSKRHITDMCCVGILFYALINATGSMSPASDYITNFIALYLIARWADLLENDSSQIHLYALLSVACVYLLTLKISGGMLLLITIYPAVMLLKQRKWKEIAIYLLLGTLAVVPFLIRNVLISGWLIYPSSGIDIFPVDWKVPIDYLRIDAKQISVWGKCLYDVSLADMPLKEWVPIWFSSQERYHLMLIGGVILSGILVLINTFRKIVHRYRMDCRLIVLYAGITASIVLWFFLSPFIRYGLAFLIALPAISIGDSLHKKKTRKGLGHIATVFLLTGIFVCFTPMVDQYVKDDGVFVKQTMLESYYIWPKNYDIAELTSFKVDGVTFYTQTEGDRLGYAPLPSTAYPFMMQRSMLRGDSIKDGFRAVD